MLANYVEVRLIGSYSGTESLVSPPNPPEHVVLLDEGLGCDATVTWIAFWRGRTPPACVVAVEMESDSETILACVEAGVSGYALRGASAREIAETILQALRGVAHCSPEVTARLFARLAAYHVAQAPLMVPLTERELEVLRCIAADFSNQDIAKALTIEVYTVKHHVHNILEKLRLRHRWDAARYAAEQGWLEDDLAR
jgi:DNA-binding NarL/FixJ family response regulator